MLRTLITAACPSVSAELRRRLHVRRERRRCAAMVEWLERLRRGDGPDGYSLQGADRLRCIFIHIPKCAGVAVAQSLFGSKGAGHARAEDYRLVYSRREYRESFKFTFVRNPWDRLVSAFCFLRGGGMNERDRAFAERHLAPYRDFESFVHGWLTPENAMLYYHFQPQLYYLSVDGRPPELDFIGRFENIDADFAHVARWLGLDTGLEVRNKSRNKPSDFRRLYTPSMVRKVAAVYRADIAALGYEFDDAGRPPRPAAFVDGPGPGRAGATEGGKSGPSQGPHFLRFRRKVR